MTIFLLWVFTPVLQQIMRCYRYEPSACWSLKDQLILESHYHPSWLLRTLFKKLHAHLSEGYALKDLLCFLSLHTAGNLTLDDLYHLLTLLSTPHPLEWSLMPFFRICCLALFPQLFELLVLPVWFGSSVGILLLALVLDQWSWLRYKMMLAQLYLWQRHPSQQCHFQNDLPIPEILTLNSDKKLWTQIFKLSGDLSKASLLFQHYYHYHHQRTLYRRRQILLSLLQLLSFLVFVQLIDQSLWNLYHHTALS